MPKREMNEIKEVLGRKMGMTGRFRCGITKLKHVYSPDCHFTLRDIWPHYLVHLSPSIVIYETGLISIFVTYIYIYFSL